MAVKTKDGKVLLKYGHVSCECCDCIDSTVSVSASDSGKTGTGISVTDDFPYLSTSSSGEIDLIHNHPVRPPAIFHAPEQLEIYIGNTFLSIGANLDSQLITLRGEVFFRIRDSRHNDNYGSYEATAVLCPTDNVVTP